MAEIPGYDFGRPWCAASPLTEEELAQLEDTVGWTKNDAACLKRHGDRFKAKAEEMVDEWRTVIGRRPHLAQWFFGPDGKPDEAYQLRVKERFLQWIVDVALREHDREWLNYQEEIGLRHLPAKKNLTDRAQTPPHVPMRYLLGFVSVVTPIERFFAGEVELQELQSAWSKAVILHTTLWARPYAREGLW